MTPIIPTITFISNYRNFLLNKTKSNGQPYSIRGINIYVGRIEGLIRQGYSEATLRRDIYILINSYAKGGANYSAADKGNTHAALKHLREYFGLPEQASGQTVISSSSKKRRAVDKSSITLPPLGRDFDCDIVKYEECVEEEERIPDLCPRIAQEYLGIRDFARSIHSDIICDDLPAVPVRLSPLRYTIHYRNSDDYVTKQIMRIVDSNGTITEKQIRNALGYTDRMLGSFVEKYSFDDGSIGPCIVLYYKQINTSDWNEYIANIINTLAHEYLHYLEYAYCTEVGMKAFSNDCVSESMADFFGALYSLSKGGACDINVAKKEYRVWQERFGSSWPYADALHFYTVNKNTMGFSVDYYDYDKHGSVEKLRNVFKESHNPNRAYNILLQW